MGHNQCFYKPVEAEDSCLWSWTKWLLPDWLRVVLWASCHWHPLLNQELGTLLPYCSCWGSFGNPGTFGFAPGLLGFIKKIFARWQWPVLLENKCGVIVLVLGQMREKEFLLSVEKNKAQSSSELLLSYIAKTQRFLWCRLWVLYYFIRNYFEYSFLPNALFWPFN